MWVYPKSFNQQAADLIELHPDEVMRADFVDIISGKTQLPGYEPLAMCYSGHQFGHYVPRLGDGRAILLGQVKTDSGENWDLQLKGAGPTPYSRGCVPPFGNIYAVRPCMGWVFQPPVPCA